MRRPNIRWTPEESVELLAQLDFVVNNSRPNSTRTDVLANIKDRLIKQKWSGKKVRTSQIEIRVKQLNRSADPKGKRIDEIYRWGIKRMEGISMEMRSMVQMRVQSIGASEAQARLTTPRQLRPPRDRSFEPAQIHTPTRGSRRQASTEKGRKSSALVKIESSPYNELSSRNVSMISTQPFLSRLITRNATAAAAPAQSCQETETAESSPLTELCTNDLESRASDQIECPLLRDNLQAFFYGSDIEDQPMMNHDDGEIVQETPDRLIIDHGLETLSHLLADVRYFEEKWLESEKRYHEKVEDKRLAHSSGLQSTSDIPEIIKRQNDTIISLTRQMKSQQRLLDFLRLEKIGQIPLNSKEIMKRYDVMKRNLRLLSTKDIAENMGSLEAEESSIDLQELRKRVPGNLEAFPAGLIVQALAAAAVCEWVFAAKIQSMAMIHTPLLEAYQFQISTICGDAALQNVDMAAHQRVVENHHFQETTLPRLAANLSKRFFKALNQSSSTEPELKTTSTKILKDIFVEALRIKSLGMIGKHVLGVVWPTHNSQFDLSSMIETDSALRGKSLESNGEVILVLVPGLLNYSDGKNMVDYCGFAKDDTQELGKPTLMAPAVVLTH